MDFSVSVTKIWRWGGLVCSQYTMGPQFDMIPRKTNAILGCINEIQNKGYIGLVFICRAFAMA